MGGLTDEVGVAGVRESGLQLLANFLRFLSPTATGLPCLLEYVTCSGVNSQVLSQILQPGKGEERGNTGIPASQGIGASGTVCIEVESKSGAAASQ